MKHVITIKSAYTTLEINNTKGSSRIAKITSNSGGTEPINIDFSVNTGYVEINLIELDDKQRKELIEFLSQKE